MVEGREKEKKKREMAFSFIQERAFPVFVRARAQLVFSGRLCFGLRKCSDWLMNAPGLPPGPNQPTCVPA